MLWSQTSSQKKPCTQIIGDPCTVCGSIPDIIPEEAGDERRRAKLVDHVIVDEPILKALAVDDRSARVVEDVEAARHLAAVACGGSACATHSAAVK